MNKKPKAEQLFILVMIAVGLSSLIVLAGCTGDFFCVRPRTSGSLSNSCTGCEISLLWCLGAEVGCSENNRAEGGISCKPFCGAASRKIECVSILLLSCYQCQISCDDQGNGEYELFAGMFFCGGCVHDCGVNSCRYGLPTYSLPMFFDPDEFLVD